MIEFVMMPFWQSPQNVSTFLGSKSARRESSSQIHDRFERVQLKTQLKIRFFFHNLIILKLLPCNTGSWDLMCCRLCLIACWSVGLNKEALHVLILPALFGVRYSYLCSAQDQNKLHIVTQSTKMDTLFDLLTDSISFVGFTRLTRLASSTLALPTAPASRSGL